MSIPEKLSAAIDRFLAGQASEEDMRMINDWYGRFDDGEVIVPDTEEAVSERIRARLQQSVHPARKPARLRWLQIAAAAAVVAGILFFAWQQITPKPANWQTEQSEAGFVRRVLLPDGSKVWLNGASTLRYQARTVELEGEAFFEVVAGQTPFTVTAGALQTTVLGTSFNVNTSAAIVNVTSGKVKVAAGGQEEIVNAGQGVQYKSGKLESMTTAENPWMQHALEFDDVSLEQITKVLSLWYDVQFEFSNAQLKTCRYTAHFDSKISLDELLKLFGDLNDIQIIKEENKIKLNGKGCQ